MRRPPLLLLAAFLAACAAPPAPPAISALPPAPQRHEEPAPPPPLPAELGRWIDAYVGGSGKRWGEAHAMQGHVAVAQRGKPIFERAYGKADRAKGLVAGPETRFRIGSLTKQFTATAILKLVEDGRLKVEDPIRKHLPDYPAVGDTITLHHLLTHTSGIPSYTSDTALMKERDKPHTRAEVIARFSGKPLEFKPGERFSYSNSGYFVLGAVIEKVSGKSYEAFLQERVLGPAGMTRTSSVDAPDAPDTAVGYTTDVDDELVPAQLIDMSLPFAAGALRSTTSDLIRWDRALAGVAVLSEASKKRMFTPEKSNYAYGWGVSRVEGHEVLGHSGGIDGFTSYIARVPDLELVVISLSNSEDFDAGPLARKILSMALTGKAVDPPEERAIAELDPARARSVAGEYTHTDASRKALEGKLPQAVLDSVAGMSVTEESGRLFMKPSGQSRVRLFAGEGGALFTKKDGIELTAGPITRGAVKTLTLRQAGIELVYERAVKKKGK